MNNNIPLIFRKNTTDKFPVQPSKNEEASKKEEPIKKAKTNDIPLAPKPPTFGMKKKSFMPKIKKQTNVVDEIKKIDEKPARVFSAKDLLKKSKHNTPKQSVRMDGKGEDLTLNHAFKPTTEEQKLTNTLNRKLKILEDFNIHRMIQKFKSYKRTEKIPIMVKMSKYLGNSYVDEHILTEICRTNAGKFDRIFNNLIEEYVKHLEIDAKFLVGIIRASNKRLYSMANIMVQLVPIFNKVGLRFDEKLMLDEDFRPALISAINLAVNEGFGDKIATILPKNPFVKMATIMGTQLGFSVDLDTQKAGAVLKGATSYIGAMGKKKQ